MRLPDDHPDLNTRIVRGQRRLGIAVVILTFTLALFWTNVPNTVIGFLIAVGAVFVFGAASDLSPLARGFWNNRGRGGWGDDL